MEINLPETHSCLQGVGRELHLHATLGNLTAHEQTASTAEKHEERYRNKNPRSSQPAVRITLVKRYMGSKSEIASVSFSPTGNVRTLYTTKQNTLQESFTRY